MATVTGSATIVCASAAEAVQIKSLLDQAIVQPSSGLKAYVEQDALTLRADLEFPLTLPQE